MQEQNFEKQVRQKMEELSLTPSEPVWKKVEEQIREKRDRRRLLFWLPLTLLLLGGGVWLMSNKINSNNSIARIKEWDNNKRNTNAPLESGTIKSDNTIRGKKETSSEINKSSTTINEPLQQKEKVLSVSKENQQLPQSAKSANKFFQKRKIVRAADAISGVKTIKTGEKVKREIVNAENSSINRKPDILSDNEKPGGNIQTKDIQVQDSIITETKVDADKATPVDTANEIKPTIETDIKDSASIENNITKTEKIKNPKWKLAITAGIGRSGVNNGVDLFGGGAKSLETNALADRYLTQSSFTNNPGSVFRQPSAQKKSASFSFGLLVKKKVSKRSSLSTGLQYNYYSTQMLVGQNMYQDTMASQTYRVTEFYANSGSGFNNYRNSFHFISLPVSFDWQIFKKIPVDFHFGLSLQQLMKTNALLYGAFSQIYYENNQAFNKTYLFSEFGFGYTFILNKTLSLSAGPRMNYSHSRVIKDSDRHLFSYGLSTQFIFSGK